MNQKRPLSERLDRMSLGEAIEEVRALEAIEEQRAKAALIDRSDEREQVPLLERTQTTKGLVAELWELHRRIVEGRFIPPSDLADRFSLLMGMALGVIWKLEEQDDESSDLVEELIGAVGCIRCSDVLECKRHPHVQALVAERNGR